MTRFLSPKLHTTLTSSEWYRCSSLGVCVRFGGCLPTLSITFTPSPGSRYSCGTDSCTFHFGSIAPGSPVIQPLFGFGVTQIWTLQRGESPVRLLFADDWPRSLSSTIAHCLIWGDAGCWKDTSPYLFCTIPPRCPHGKLLWWVFDCSDERFSWFSAYRRCYPPG